jgi:integrase/recombinase XerD
LCPLNANALFTRWSEQAGIEPPITPHLLRHAFATHLLENGASIRHVQAMLGHARIETTARYTSVAFKALNDIMRRLDPRAVIEMGASNSGPSVDSRFSL